MSVLSLLLGVYVVYQLVLLTTQSHLFAMQNLYIYKERELEWGRSLSQREFETKRTRGNVLMKTYYTVNTWRRRQNWTPSWLTRFQELRVTSHTCKRIYLQSFFTLEPIVLLSSSNFFCLLFCMLRNATSLCHVGTEHITADWNSRNNMPSFVNVGLLYGVTTWQKIKLQTQKSKHEYFLKTKLYQWYGGLILLLQVWLSLPNLRVLKSVDFIYFYVTTKV